MNPIHIILLSLSLLWLGCGGGTEAQTAFDSGSSGETMVHDSASAEVSPVDAGTVDSGSGEFDATDGSVIDTNQDASEPSDTENDAEGDLLITDPCTPNPCAHGGVCSPGEDGLSATCDCEGTGYTGEFCTELQDACASEETNCSEDATCASVPDGYVCTCNDGFEGDGVECTDIDECAVNNGGCDPLAACINVPGSVVCQCPPGMDGDGFVCGPDPTTLTYQGLHGYIGSSSAATPELYRYGASFYSAAWRLTPEPLKFFQIGLPGTWFTPDNSDNKTTPLCPPGTLAADNWPERAPTYATVFQTMEGGLGYWANNQYRYGPPKFSMNATPDCYTSQIASPGWAFFNGPTTLPDTNLGIAQLSNRMLIPPDGLPFGGEPQGELIGYGFIALPLTDPRPDPQPTGDQNWTLFLNSTNFKGPLAYYLPETWSKISKNYPFDEGRGLDSRRINAGLGGSMEINTVQQYQATAADGALYTKIPQLQFPVDGDGKTILVRDLTFYSKGALYDDVLAWRQGGSAPSGQIAAEDTFKPSLYTYPVTYKQSGQILGGINELATPTVFENDVFGLQWTNVDKAGMAKFPRYFKQQGNQRVAISEADVPPETKLTYKEFPKGTDPGTPYSAEPLDGAWNSPGPAAGPFNVDLGDCSTITYYWYKFIDQPVFQQHLWTAEEKADLQSIVEKMHQQWTPNKEYLPGPTGGELAGFDPGLLVTPPAGLEVGYVPVVTRQEASMAPDCPAQLQAEAKEKEATLLSDMTAADLQGEYKRYPVQNGWHEVTISLDDQGQLWWKNAATQWTLFFENGVLTTGFDCPYGVSTLKIEFLKGAQGQIYGMPAALLFNNEGYQKVW